MLQKSKYFSFFLCLVSFEAFSQTSDLATAPWVVRLILPSRLERVPGGVHLEVLQSPNPSFIGKEGTLVLERRETHSGFVETLYGYPLTPDRRDVYFDGRAARGLRNNILHPVRLNGWNDVSFLESLAGARPEDDMIVELESPEIIFTDPLILRVKREPIQVSGPTKIFVKFISDPDENSIVEVIHYDRETADFSGKREQVLVNLVKPTAAVSELFRPVASLHRIHEHTFNAEGFILFGHRDDSGKFTATSLEPSSLFYFPEMGPEPMESISSTSVQDAVWIGLNYLRASGRFASLAAGSTRYAVGDEFLVAHAFGGNSNSPRTLGLITGHFSWGTAKLERHTWTGRPYLKIIYEQIYAHNSRGLISGRQSWAEYATNFQRGNAWSRSFSDLIIPLPFLFDSLIFPSGELSPIDWIRYHLSEMSYLYRTGDGSGVANVVPYASCCQDSNQAFLSAIEEFARGARRQIDSSRLSAEDLEQLRQIEALARDYHSRFSSLHLLPFLGNPPLSSVVRGSDSYMARASGLYFALTRARSLFPRGLFDRLFSLFDQHSEDELMIVQTGLLDNPELGRDVVLPLAPSSPFSSLRAACRELSAYMGKGLGR